MNCERARIISPSIRWRDRLAGSLLVVLIAALVLVVPIPAAAQRITGTLRGQVFDPTGAAVPNAQVTATNQETGVSVKITTTSAGTDSFPSLIPGLYKGSVKVQGVKNFLATDISGIDHQSNGT